MSFRLSFLDRNPRGNNGKARDDRIYMIEQYADQAAMDAHMGSETLAALYPKIGPFMADGGAVMGSVHSELD